ncbi:MAG: hypothetical protein ACJ76T_16555 [Solirubrobacteraceae bacterium]
MIDPRPRGEPAIKIDGVDVSPAKPGIDGAVLRVSGRWTRGWPLSPSAPALFVGEQRLEALSGFEDRRDDRWQASFAVPEALRPALTRELALDVGGGRIALPAPAAPDEPVADVVHAEVLVDRRAAHAQAQARGAVETKETLSALDAERARLELALERAGEERATLRRRAAEAQQEAYAASAGQAARAVQGPIADGRSAVEDLRAEIGACEKAQRELEERTAADHEDFERLEAELREREISQRRLEGALEGLRRRVGAVVEAERARATGGAVLNLVAVAGKALDEAEQRIEDVKAAARDVEVELARERAERAAYEEALQRRIAELVAAQAPEPESPPPRPTVDEPAFDAAEQRLSGLLERLAVLEERAAQELGADGIGPPLHARPPGREALPAEAAAPPAPPLLPPPAGTTAAPHEGTARPHPRERRPAADRVGTGGWIAPALLGLAAADAPAAGRLAVALLPAQAQASGLELDADVVFDGAGAWRVAASPDSAAAVPLDAPRGRWEADFVLTTEPAAFVDFLAGRRRLRGRPRIRVHGSRRRARQLRGLATSAPIALGEALGAGIDLGAGLAWRAVAAAIAPAWTAGARFTVAFEAGEMAPFYVHAEDGAPIAIDGEPGPDPPAATIRGSDRAIVALLAGEQPDDGDKASIRGELDTVRALQEWVARAQDPARATA